jgi:signal transduction histidine kinase
LNDRPVLSEMRAQHTAMNEAELRRAPVLLQATALFVSLALIPLVPGGHAIAGVPWQGSFIWAATLITFMWTTYLVHRIAGGGSRAHAVIEVTESVVFAHGSAVLAGLSSHVASIWWLIFFAHCVYSASAVGKRRADAPLFITAPITAAAVTYLRSHVLVDAVTALFIGGLGVVAWSVIARATDRSLVEAADRDVLRTRVADLEREQGRTRAEAERRRIAMELHDGVGATLTAARLMAQAVRRDGTESERAEKLDALEQTLSEGLSDLRLAVWSLDQTAVAWPEMCARVRRHCADVCAAAQLDFTMTTSGDLVGATPPALRLVVFRLAQEALTNTLRHANAKSISLRILVSDETLTFAYRDDGRGLPREPHVDGRGLANMRRRVEEIGGSLDVESSLGCGTSLTARLPIDRGDGGGG